HSEASPQTNVRTILLAYEAAGGTDRPPHIAPDPIPRRRSPHRYRSNWVRSTPWQTILDIRFSTTPPWSYPGNRCPRYNCPETSPPKTVLRSWLAAPSHHFPS